MEEEKDFFQEGMNAAEEAMKAEKDKELMNDYLNDKFGVTDEK